MAFGPDPEHNWLDPVIDALEFKAHLGSDPRARRELNRRVAAQTKKENGRI